MISKIKNLGKVKVFLSLASLLLLAQLLPALSASAATLGETFVRFDSMNASSQTTGLVCAEPTTTASTVASVVVGFPTGFTVSPTTSNWTTSTATTTGWPTGAVAWPGIGTATSISGQNVTFPSTTLGSSSTLYCFNWTNAAALIEPSSIGSSETGTITTQTSAPATIDTGTYATATVTNDQVTVTGTVAPTFTMSFSANTDPLGTLSQGTVSSSNSSTFTVNTNDKNGWMAWVKDANSGLHSASASYTIGSTSTPGIGVASTALTAGTEGINLGISYSQTGGNCNTATAVSNYFNGAGGKGGSFNTTLLPILTCSGSTNQGVVVPTNYASINGSTPPASDYTDVETFVAAGLF